MIKKIIVALTLALFTAPMMMIPASAEAYGSCGFWGYRHCGSHIKNMRLVYKVVKNLRASAATFDQPIYVSAVGHKVFLSGFVGTASQKQAAIDITRFTCGVGLVVDGLRLRMP